MSIKMLVMDVDGTLTDGHIYVGENGEMMKAFNVKDGYAIVKIMPESKIVPVIITGKISEIVRKRAAELKIQEVYQNVSDKLPLLIEIAEKYGVTSDEVAYIGDDVNDLQCIEWCGITACPSDAVDEVLQQVDYICKAQGGRGAVREFIDWIVKNQVGTI